MFLTTTGKYLVTEIGVELPPGRLVGELGFLTPNNKRTATVECIEDGSVLTISYDRLLEVYFGYPDFGYYFLHLASRSPSAKQCAPRRNHRTVQSQAASVPV